MYNSLAIHRDAVGLVLYTYGLLGTAVVMTTRAIVTDTLPVFTHYRSVRVRIMERVPGTANRALPRWQRR